MAMGNVSTSEEGMRAAAQQFAAKADEFTSANRSVAGQVDVLMASWTGPAAQGYRSAMEQWGQSFNEVIRALREMQGQMERTRAGYNQAEDEASSATRQLGSGLPGI
ncbi:hypothetical protein GCM10009541_35290 [Micromonospora gifhornensis]|uniref:ESAT-6-like protein n=1 Tax=Micromonospora gifhornensis TaxID=84594 RepID=A0ABQ4IJP1_9ACTN|nr:WXG100 family type VII secretion target [Micromonospora gifhornensis]GIJ18109.1 hypothetical protein Vgi01_47930 [Micromonospora gifhornensis]